MPDRQTQAVRSRRLQAEAEQAAHRNRKPAAVVAPSLLQAPAVSLAHHNPKQVSAATRAVEARPVKKSLSLGAAAQDRPALPS
jgi:hypothetical protein